MIKRKSLSIFIMGLLLTVSILAQMWGTIIADVSRKLLYPGWVIAIPVLLFIFGEKRIKIPAKGRFSITFSMLFAFYAILVHQGVGGFLKFSISIVLCYVIGLILGMDHFEEDSLKVVLFVYVILILILSAFIKQEAIGTINTWMESQTYSYGSKNSSGQLIAVAIIVLIMYLVDWKSHKLISFLLSAMAVVLLIMLLLVQCRSALVSLTSAIALYIIKRFQHDKRVVGIVLLLALLIFFALQNNLLWLFLRRAFFIDKYIGADLNTFSSGRIVLWKKAILDWAESPIFGKGAYYVDNMYLCSLAENGLIGFILLMSVHFSRIKWNLALHKRKSNGVSEKMRDMVFVMTIFYFTESFFEGYPPFGPGICSCLYWILSGFVDNKASDCKNYSVTRNGYRI